MERKDLKIYEAPVSGVVELKLRSQILSGSPDKDDPFDGSTEKTPEEE